MTYPPQLALTPLSRPVDATVRVPGSKSITNRALVLAALASRETDCALTGALRSEDTEVMVECLNRLGYRVTPDWPREAIHVRKHGSDRLVPAEAADLWVANSGTTVRFLAALVSLSPGRYRLDGVPRMRERPIQDLLDALSGIPGVGAIGEDGTFCPPVLIGGRGWPADERVSLSVRAGVSSQFASGLLMAAAFAPGGADVSLDGAVVSEPYIAMTVRMCHDWGRRVIVEPGRYVIDPGHHPLAVYRVEPDASSASYFFAAAAVTQGTVTVGGLTPDAMQGDVKFVDLLAKMGCKVEPAADGVGLTVTGRKWLRGIDCDMNAVSDTVMTLASVACFADGPTRIRNVAHIRHKETDRLAAVATELRKLGAGVEEHLDGLTIHPKPLTGCVVSTYKDHRMAMSLAVVGLRVPGVVIDDPGCVAKTYPGFWDDWAALADRP